MGNVSRRSSLFNGLKSFTLVFLAGIGIAPEASAQFILTGTNYNQNFDSIGTALPTGFTVRTGSTATVLGTTANFTTSLTSWNTATGQFSNQASATGLTSTAVAATQNASTDRAVALRQSSSFGDPGASFNFYFNSSGFNLSAMSLDLQLLSVQGRSTAFTIQYGLGATPSSFSNFTNGTYTDPGVFGTTTFSVAAADLVAISNQSDVWFRVIALTASTGANSRDTVAVDNLAMAFTPTTVVTTYTYTGTGAPPSGLFQNGTLSKFDAVYANGLQNPVVFTGTGESVAVTGTVQAGNLTFSADGYNLTGGASDTLELGGIGSVTVGPAFTATIGAKLIGTAGFTKVGTGTLVLTNIANSFTGTVNVAAGVLSINDNGQLGDVANAVNLSGGTLKFTNGIGIGRNIAGSGIIDILTGGTVVSSGTFNTSTITLSNQGTLSLQGTTPTIGNLSFSAAGTLAASGLVAASGLTATLLTSGTATVNAGLAFTTGDKTVDVGAGGTLALAGNNTGTGRIAKTGLGTLILSGDNSGLAGIRVGASAAAPTSGGVVIATNALAFGPGTSVIQHNFGAIQASTPLVFANGLSIGGRTNGPAELGGTNAMEFQGATSFFRGTGTSGEMRLNVNNTTTLSGVLSGATGTGGTSTGITFGGTGVLILGGTTTNTVADNLTITDTLFVSAAKASALGASPIITIGTTVTPTLPTLDTTANSGYTLGSTVAQTIRGVGILAGPLTLESLGKIQGGSTGSATAANTLNTGSITLNTGATLRTIVGDAAVNSSSTDGQASLIKLGTNSLNKGTASTSPAYTISLSNDGSLEMDLPYTVTVADFASSTGGLLASDFNVVAENFAFTGTPTVNLSSTLLTVTFTPTAVPEPGTLLGLSAASIGFVGWVRRRRSMGK